MKDLTRNFTPKNTSVETFTKWSDHDKNLNNKLLQTKENVHAALCGKFYLCELCYVNNDHFSDNIDTRVALDALRELVTTSNIYIKEIKSPNSVQLYDIALYITQILKIFGTISDTSIIGFPSSQEGTTNVSDSLCLY